MPAITYLKTPERRRVGNWAEWVEYDAVLTDARGITWYRHVPRKHAPDEEWWNADIPGTALSVHDYGQRHDAPWRGWRLRGVEYPDRDAAMAAAPLAAAESLRWELQRTSAALYEQTVGLATAVAALQIEPEEES